MASSKRDRTGASDCSKTPSRGKSTGASDCSKTPSRGKSTGASDCSKTLSRGKSTGASNCSKTPSREKSTGASDCSKTLSRHGRSDSGYALSTSASTSSGNRRRNPSHSFRSSSRPSSGCTGPGIGIFSQVGNRIPNHRIGIIGERGAGRNHLAACLAGRYDGDTRIYERRSLDSNFSVYVVPTHPDDPMQEGGTLGFWWERPGSLRWFVAIIYIYADNNLNSLEFMMEKGEFVKRTYPNLRHGYLVCNKVDLRCDLRYMQRECFVPRSMGWHCELPLGARDSFACSALYGLGTIELERCLLSYLLPQLYFRPNQCPSLSMPVPRMSVYIVGDVGTGRNTLAYRLTNLVGVRSILTQRTRRVRCPSRQVDVNLDVFVVPSELFGDSEEGYWIAAIRKRLDVIILLYAVDHGPSLISVIGKWANINSILRRHRSRPLVCLVGNKTDIRPVEQPLKEGLMISDPGFVVATNVGIELGLANGIPESEFYECSATEAVGTTELQQYIINKRFNNQALWIDQ